MKEKSVLIIDDSSTIRRLVDSELSNAGYRVIMAASAEVGVELANDQLPDLIILDHQLPGTTGYDVCCQLLAKPETARIPVVASSTLRKKAYAEYVDCDNVVDMLPKPYTADVLIATIESAIDTAAMVVQSQNEGSAVPEVINELGESDLSGAFGCFGLREILDLLNNGSKSGVLEVETDRCRVFVFVGQGRVQSVTASGINPEEVARYMPTTLSELMPVIKFTLGGRRGSEVDSLVELLDTKVLDPRLLKKLLRLQAAVLLRLCFTGKPKAFRFTGSQNVSPLLKKLPLDCSLLSLLVEGALICDQNEVPQLDDARNYVRKAIRGQNLDRAGLSSRHMKLMAIVSQSATAAQIADRLGWPLEETLRVLHGFELAELIESSTAKPTTTVFCVTNNSPLTQKFADYFESNKETVSGKVVRDWIALRLLLRRHKPDFLLVQATDPAATTQLGLLNNALQDVQLVGIQPAVGCELDPELAAKFNHWLGHDFDTHELTETIESKSEAKVENPISFVNQQPDPVEADAVSHTTTMETAQ